MHCMHFEEKYGVGPHTISVRDFVLPWSSFERDSVQSYRQGFQENCGHIPNCCSIYGIILSTRERAEFRDELLSVGVSQISAGSKTNPGGYQEDETMRISLK